MNTKLSTRLVVMLGLLMSASYLPAAEDYRLLTLNPYYYLESYPDLKAAFGNDYNRARQHWLDNGIREGRQSSSSFGVADYLNRHADLKSAFGSNYDAALNHWASNGMQEGRNPVPQVPNNWPHDPRLSVLDPEFYLKKYPDLASAFGGTNFEAAKSHWLQHGIGEGRQPSATFSIQAYLERYPDLAQAFGNNYSAALDHWLNRGRTEIRNPLPKADSYLK